jgi:hypothetical protein
MRRWKNRNSDENLTSLLSAVEKQAVVPDSEFLKELRERSAREFAAGAPSVSANTPKSIRIAALWSMIMKSPLTKLAVAAVVVIACVIGLSLWRTTGSGIALADVLARVEQVKAFKSRVNYALTQRLPSGEPNRFETRSTCLTSQEYGWKINCEAPDPNGEWIPVTVFCICPQKKTLIQISPRTKRYMRLRWDDAEAQQQQEELSQSSDPGALLKGIMACKYENLGRSTIDGVDVEGFRTTDCNCNSQMSAPVFRNREVEVKVWVDVKKRLPVRYESLTTGLDRRGNPTSHRFVTDDFQWDVPVTAADFEPPPVPDGYEVVDRPGVIDEEAAIQGLKQCAELIGSYLTISEGEGSGWTVVSALEKSETPAAVRLKEQIKELPEMQKLNTVRRAVIPMFEGFMRFYNGLVQDKKDPAYYGKTVTPKDADKVLLRWKVSDSKYRVIFGDLHAETVSPEKLAELEKVLPK